MSRTVVEVALDDPDPATDSANWAWTDWTAYVERDTAGVSIFRGYRDGSDRLSPTEIGFRGKNGDLRWSIHHPNNPYLGRIRKRTPVRVSRNYGAAVVRALGYIEQTNLVSAVGGTYKAVDVVCYGVTFQAESAAETESVLYGQIARNPHLVSYVPGEDASGATSLRNTVAGQPPASVISLSLAADGEILGSKPLWMIAEPTGSSFVRVNPYPQPYPQEWGVSLVVKIPAEPAGSTIFHSVNCDVGNIKRWLFQVVPGTPAQLQVLGHSITGVDLLTGTTTVDFVDADGVEPWGRTVGIVMFAFQSGADIEWSMYLYCRHDVFNTASGISGTVAAQTLGAVAGRSTWPTSAIDGWTFGHWATYDNANAIVFFNGYQGEDLFLQFFTIAVDADLPLAVFGSTTTSTGGPLEPGKSVDKLQTVAAGESGLIIETMGGQVALVTREDLTNQTVALTIDQANKQILSMDSIDDSFQSANRVIVTDASGDSVTVDAAYPYDPVTVGWVRDASLSTNLLDVDQVRGAGEMRVAELSYQDYRYRITLEFDGPASGLRTTFLSSVDIGSRIQITGNYGVGDPSTLDTIDQQVMGIQEFHTEQTYTVTLNTRPAGPWQMFEVESATLNKGRADTRGAWTLADIDDNDTSVLVGSYDDRERIGAKFSTTALPYDLALRTVDRVTCTAITNRTCTFVAAGTAVHANAASVSPGAAAGIALGDLDLMLCSIRDSAGFAWLSGVADRRALIVADQLGWKELAAFGGANDNFALFGRTYVGTAAPTLAPQNPEATDTVSAQRCAFRYAQPVIHRAALPLSNASAANIAYPGLPSITRANTLVILITQKDDDATSTTAPAGFTKISDLSSTLGDDQSLSWHYQIQTTATDVPAGTLTVAGGAANTSKATMISLVTDVQTLTVTRAVNTGTVTSHPTLADVRLWHAGRLTR